MADNWSLDLIQYYVKVAELKNITAAANELYITQPTLSHQMQKIETNLGISLYTRQRSGIELTQEGERFYRICKKFLRAYEEFNTDAHLLSDNPVGTLKIGYPKSATQFLLEHNSNFARKYPGVFLKNYRQGQKNGIDMLMENELDFFYLHGLEIENLPQPLKTIPVGSNPFMVLMSTENPLASRKSVSIADLSNMRFVMPSEKHAAGRIALLNRSCRKYGFVPNIVNYHYQLSEYVIDMMTYPDIVTVQPRITNLENEYDGKIVYVALKNYMAEDEICLAWSQTNPNPLIPLYARQVSETMKKALEQKN